MCMWAKGGKDLHPNRLVIPVVVCTPKRQHMMVKLKELNKWYGRTKRIIIIIIIVHIGVAEARQMSRTRITVSPEGKTNGTGKKKSKENAHMRPKVYGGPARMPSNGRSESNKFIKMNNM